MIIHLNGKEVSVAPHVDPSTPLLWYLRDELNMTGTKYGCGKGLCGACTVHVDGQPARSCSITINEVANAKIITIEGLDARDKVASALKKAWVDHHVPQCGYCQSGQIMGSVCLLRETPKPSDSQIDAAMEGNICRCGTYVRVRAAIHQAAKEIG